MDMLIGLYHVPGALFWHVFFYDKNSKVPEWLQALLNQIVNLVFWGTIVFSIWLLF